jgi:hypothetical protein
VALEDLVVVGPGPGAPEDLRTVVGADLVDAVAGEEHHVHDRVQLGVDQDLECPFDLVRTGSRWRLRGC